MSWPETLDYNAAIQNLRSSFGDAELREGEPVLNAMGLPMPRSGNFADVYEVRCPATGRSWAVKCFKRELPGLQDRYREIAAHLKQAQLPFMVDFDYVERGVLIRGAWYPVLKMSWVEGFSLNQVVSEYLDKPSTLKTLLRLWTRLAQRLEEAHVAHGDLQHGNVLLVPVAGSDQLGLRLIDYDGMFVPSLAGQKPAESGHPNFQHPHRTRDGTYNGQVDRFSHLVICCAIRSLVVGRRELWEEFDNGDNLLFREQDFQSPATSPLFQDLWKRPDADARNLAGRLILAAMRPLDDVPSLDSVIVDGKVQDLTARQRQEVEALLNRGASRVRTVARFRPSPAYAPDTYATAGEGGGEPWWLSGQLAAPTAPTLDRPRIVLRPRRPSRWNTRRILRCAIAAAVVLGAISVGVMAARSVLSPGSGMVWIPAAPRQPQAVKKTEVARKVVLPPAPPPPPPRPEVLRSYHLDQPKEIQGPKQEESAPVPAVKEATDGGMEQRVAPPPSPPPPVPDAVKPGAASQDAPPSPVHQRLDREEEEAWTRWARAKADRLGGSLLQRIRLTNGEATVLVASAAGGSPAATALSSHDAVSDRYCLGAGRLYYVGKDDSSGDVQVYLFGEDFDKDRTSRFPGTRVQEIPDLAERLGLLSVHVALLADGPSARVVVEADADSAAVQRRHEKIKACLEQILRQQKAAGPIEAPLRELSGLLNWKDSAVENGAKSWFETIRVPANKELQRLEALLKYSRRRGQAPGTPDVANPPDAFPPWKHYCRELSIIVYKGPGK